MPDIQLTREQELESQRFARIIGQKVQEETLEMARLLASKPDAQLLSKTEFDLRDCVHRIGANAIETALKERKNGIPRVEHDLSEL